MSKLETKKRLEKKTLNFTVSNKKSWWISYTKGRPLDCKLIQDFILLVDLKKVHNNKSLTFLSTKCECHQVLQTKGQQHFLLDIKQHGDFLGIPKNKTKFQL